MKEKTFCLLISVGLLLTACSPNKSHTEDHEEIADTPFIEGVIEMGLYSHGIDIGYFIDNIDFSRSDTKEQFEQLAQQQGGDHNLIDLFRGISERNPMAGFVLPFNTVISNYYIRHDRVTGKARGFGFTYDHLHNPERDEGKIFMETKIQLPQISPEDRKLYLEYTPSLETQVGANTSFQAELFDRKGLNEKENILGYACDITVYTPKDNVVAPPPGLGIPSAGSMYKKIVIYTSPLFSNNINFAHPFYVPEESGILRVDIYMEDSEQPTLEMRPYKITPQAINDTHLDIARAEPIYGMNDVSWAMKAMAIFMSGWATFED